jgi:hypothetical protein
MLPAKINSFASFGFLCAFYPVKGVPLETKMRKTLILAAGAAALLVAGCMGPGYRHERVAVGVGGPGYYDGYYDGHYGAFHDGYWGNDGNFWYSDDTNNWHRDDGHHFRRDGGDGWNAVHGSGHSRDN